MLPEPTIPEPSAAPLAVARPHPVPARQRAREGAAQRGPGKDSLDLLAVTPERFRRALWHSFLRYGVGGDLDTAVHAAMNVLGPVLEARDAEITRLREAATPAKPPARPRAAAGRVGAPVMPRRRRAVLAGTDGATADGTVSGAQGRR